MRQLRALLLAATLLAAAARAFAQPSDPYLEPTIDVHSTHPDIVAKANELETPLRIFKFVRNEIQYEVYYGSKKGALGTLWTGAGNDFDQASLLIALFRAKGYRARYRIGVVHVDRDQLTHWSGVRDFWAVAAFWAQYCRSTNVGPCAANPKRFELTSTNYEARLEHAWVEVDLPAQYRGLDVGASNRVWVPLDPSWKQKRYRTPVILPLGNETVPGGCAGKLCFDYPKYWSKVESRLASEIWEDQIKAHLAQTAPGKTPDDAIFDGPIIAFEGEVLPAGLPFAPEPVPAVISAASLVGIGDGLVRHWKIGVGLSHPTNSDPGCIDYGAWSCAAGYRAARDFYTVELVGRRLTVSFRPASSTALYNFLRYGGYDAGEFTDNGSTRTLLGHCLRDSSEAYCAIAPVLKLDGDEIAFAMNPSGITFNRGLGDTRFRLEIRRDFVPGHSASAFGAAETIAELAGGEYVAIGLDAQHTSDVEFGRRVDALLALRANLSLVDEGEGDLNGNGVEGEVLIEQGGPCSIAGYFASDAMTECDIAIAAQLFVSDDLIGELLHLAALRYFQRGRVESERVLALDSARGLYRPDVGVAKAGFAFTYLFGQPVGVEPSAPVIDVKGSAAYVSALGAGPTDHQPDVRREARLEIQTRSALEHQVWEELIGSPFVSTVKGFQLVRERFPEQPLREFDETSTNVSVQLEVFPFDPISAATRAAVEAEAAPEQPCPSGRQCVSYAVSPIAAVSASPPPIEVYLAEHAQLESGVVRVVDVEAKIAGGGQVFGGGLGLAVWEGAYDVLAPAVAFEPTSFYLFEEINQAWGTHGLTNDVPGTSSSWVSEVIVGDPVSMLSGNLHHTETDFTARTDGPSFEMRRTYNSRVETEGALGFGWTHSYEARIEPVVDEQEFVYLPSAGTGFDNYDFMEGIRSDTLETWNEGGDGYEKIQWNALPAAFSSKASVESIVLEIAFLGKFEVEPQTGGGQRVYVESGSSPKFERIALLGPGGADYLALGAVEVWLKDFQDSSDIDDTLYFARLRIRYRGPPVRRIALEQPLFQPGWPPDAEMSPLRDRDPSTCVTPTAETSKVSFDPVSTDAVFGHEMRVAVVSNPGSGATPRARLWRGDSGAGSSESMMVGPNGYSEAARQRFISTSTTTYLDSSGRPLLTFQQDPNNVGGSRKNQLCQLEYEILTIPDSVDFVGEDGSRERFTRSGSTWVGTPGVRDVLESDGAGYRLTRPNGTQLHFQQTGTSGTLHLTRTADPQGRSLVLTYAGGRLDRVSDDSAVEMPGGGLVTPFLQFFYQDGHLASVTDRTSRVWEYDVDAAGHLLEARDPLEVAEQRTGTRYEYGLAAETQYESLWHNLTRIVYPKDADAVGGGDHWVRFEYFNSDRVASHTDSLGNQQTFLFNVQRLENQTTDARGFTTVYRHDRDGNLLQRLDPDGATWTWEYDEERNVIAETDPLGRVRGFREFDARGNPKWIDDPDGRSVMFEYDPLTGTPRTIVDKRGNARAVAFTPDGLPEVVSATVNGQADTLLATHAYDATSRALATTLEPLGDGTGRFVGAAYTYFAGSRDVRQVETREYFCIPACVPSGPPLSTTLYEYDGLGQRTSETTSRVTSPSDPTPIALTTQHEYDLRGRLTQTTQPDGSARVSLYDDNGNLEEEYLEELRATGPPVLHGRTRYAYDAIDRRIAILDAAGGTTQLAYDPAGNLIATTDPEGHVSRVEYDAMNRPVRAIDANGAVTTTEYDRMGRLLAVTDPTGVRTTRAYDGIGRLVELRLGDLAPATRKPCYADTTGCRDPVAPGGYTDEITDPNGHVDAYAFDELGRVVRHVDGTPEAGVTQVQRDLRGNLRRVDDPEGGVTWFGRDGLGRVTSVKHPYATTFLLTQYDTAGNPIRITKPDGCELLQSYDELGRLVQRQTGPAGPASCRTAERRIDDGYAYDARGLLSAARNAQIGLLRDYDALGRLTRETDDRFGTSVAYQYDAASRLTAKVTPDGSVLHVAYDGAGRPVGITDPTGDTTRYVYDAAGRRVQTRSTASSLRTELAYDAVGRLDALAGYRADATARPLVRYPAYDAAGNRLARDDEQGTTSYAYDALHRLVSADPPGAAPAVHYAYDRAGNRLASGEQDAGGAFTAPYQTYSYEAGVPLTIASHRLREVRDAGGTPLEVFVYDENGNPGIWAHPGLRFLAWDTLDRLVSITGNFSATYRYDPLGRRIEKTESGETLRYQYDGLDPVAEYSVSAGGASVLAATYVFGPGIDEPIKIRRGATLAAYHSDGLGSILAVSSVTVSGASDLLTYRYDAFGVIEASTGTLDSTYTYTGRELDQSGLYYYRARYYLPSTGRFLTPDPIGLEGGINPYAYVGSNPVNYTDPFGLLGTFHIARAGPPAPSAFENQSVQSQGQGPAGYDMIPGAIGWKVGISELPIRDLNSAGAVITAAGTLGGVVILGSQLSAAVVAAEGSTAFNQGLMLAGGAISHSQGAALSTALRVVASAEAIPLVGEFTGGVAKGFAQGLGVARFAPSGGLVEAAGRTVGNLPFAINQQLKVMTGAGVASWF